MLHEDVTVYTPRIEEPDSPRVFYSNMLPGFRLLVDDSTLLLCEENSLKPRRRDLLISFPDDHIGQFATKR